jgi:hypothetical protein
MADFTASTGLRDVIAEYLDTLTYYITLHDATGGIVAGDTYSAGVRGELATAYGYTRGTKTIDLTNTGGVLDGPDATWTASGGSIGPAAYAAIWISTDGNAAGARLLTVDDKSATPQTATDGLTMTAGTPTAPITIPTPA